MRPATCRPTRHKGETGVPNRKKMRRGRPMIQPLTVLRKVALLGGQPFRSSQDSERKGWPPPKARSEGGHGKTKKEAQTSGASNSTLNSHASRPSVVADGPRPRFLAKPIQRGRGHLPRRAAAPQLIPSASPRRGLTPRRGDTSGIRGFFFCFSVPPFALSESKPLPSHRKAAPVAFSFGLARRFRPTVGVRPARRGPHPRS